jgi:hypothetical protein
MKTKNLWFLINQTLKAAKKFHRELFLGIHLMDHYVFRVIDMKIFLTVPISIAHHLNSYHL